MKRTLVFLLAFGLLLGVAWADEDDPPRRHMMWGAEEEAPMFGPGMGFGRMGAGYGMMGAGCGMMGPAWGMGYYMGPGMMGPCWGMSGQGCEMYGPGGGITAPGHGMGYGRGFGMMGFGWRADPQMKVFLEETRDLRRKLHMKVFDYWESFNDPKTSLEDLEKMEKEIQELVIEIRRMAPWK